MENREGRRLATKKYDLVQLAIELGFTPKKVGRAYYTLEEHDSVRINIAKNTFNQWSTGAYGDPVSFLMTFGESTDTRFRSVDYCIRHLESQLRITPEKRVSISKETERKHEPLILPEADKDNKRVYAYLTQTRCIDEKIVKLFLDHKWVYQSAEKYKNCIFVSYKDDKPVFATERSSNPHQRFMKEFSGNDYDHCFFIGKEGSQTLIVTEAIIDMMSIMTKEIKTNIHEKHSFLSINSVTKDAAVYAHLKKHPEYDTVMLCLDNDEAGKEASKKITDNIKQKFKNVSVMKIVPKLEGCKDFNEELVATVTRNNKEKELESEELEVSL